MNLTDDKSSSYDSVSPLSQTEVVAGSGMMAVVIVK